MHIYYNRQSTLDSVRMRRTSARQVDAPATAIPLSTSNESEVTFASRLGFAGMGLNPRTTQVLLPGFTGRAKESLERSCPRRNPPTGLTSGTLPPQIQSHQALERQPHVVCGGG